MWFLFLIIIVMISVSFFYYFYWHFGLLSWWLLTVCLLATESMLSLFFIGWQGWTSGDHLAVGTSNRSAPTVGFTQPWAHACARECACFCELFSFSIKSSVNCYTHQEQKKLWIVLYDHTPVISFIQLITLQLTWKAVESFCDLPICD